MFVKYDYIDLLLQAMDNNSTFCYVCMLGESMSPLFYAIVSILININEITHEKTLSMFA